MAIYTYRGFTLTGTGKPEQIDACAVSPEFFQTLSVQPMLGRVLLPEEEQPGRSNVVVLSYRFWQEHFGSNRDVVGHDVTIDGRNFLLAGVMPPNFLFPEFAQMWTPMAWTDVERAVRGEHHYVVIARLKPGVDVHQANAEMNTISSRLEQLYPADDKGWGAVVVPLHDDMVSDVRPAMLVLLGAVACVLLIACVNVANLLLVRAVARRREMAVRVALGAATTRVMTELVTESLVLAGVACAVGVALAELTRRLLVAAAPASIPRLAGVTLDWRVLIFAALVSLVTGLGFGLLPAWQAGRTRPVDALRSSERVVAGTWVMKWRNALMVVEIALSTILLTGAGLMLKSLVLLNGVELGFEPNRVLTANVSLPETRYATADDRLRFFDALAARLAAQPGVEDVAFANRFPLRGGWETGIGVDGLNGPGDGTVDVACQAVSPGYFRTLGIPLMRGRLLTPADVKTTEPVAVVSDEFGRNVLVGGDPIGRRFRRGPTAPWITIVGVVHDVRRDGRDTAITPQVFLPAAQTNLYPVRLADVAIRTSANPLALAATIRTAVLDIDPSQPITGVRTLDEILSARAAERRFETLLFGLFAALAIVLAVVGIFGVVSYAVSQRTPEIGVRMALGADGGRILRWLLGRTAMVVAIGAIAGVAGSVALSRFVATLLFQVQPRDRAVYTIAALLLSAVALATAALAARAATRVNPTTALRAD
jgi:putative ABC transport system permease protein